MKTPEELRARIIELVQKETSEDKLSYLLYTIEHSEAELPALSEAEEKALDEGMADIEAGRVVSATEVWADINRWREERRASQRHAG